MTEPLIVTVPGLRLASEMNTRGHWRTRKRRFDAQKDLVLCALTQIPTKIRRQYTSAPRVDLTLVRVYGPRGRRFDRDNLAGAFKAVLDATAGWLGRSDGDEARLGFAWAQASGPDYAVRLEFRVP